LLQKGNKVDRYAITKQMYLKLPVKLPLATAVQLNDGAGVGATVVYRF
jgi:hypothetical protein